MLECHLVKLTSPELKNPSLKVKERKQSIHWQIISCLNICLSKGMHNLAQNPLPKTQNSKWWNALKKSMWVSLTDSYLNKKFRTKAKLAIKDTTKCSVVLCHLIVCHFTEQHIKKKNITRNWLWWIGYYLSDAHPHADAKQSQNTSLKGHLTGSHGENLQNLLTSASPT